MTSHSGRASSSGSKSSPGKHRPRRARRTPAPKPWRPSGSRSHAISLEWRISARSIHMTPRKSARPLVHCPTLLSSSWRVKSSRNRGIHRATTISASPASRASIAVRTACHLDVSSAKVAVSAAAGAEVTARLYLDRGQDVKPGQPHESLIVVAGSTPGGRRSSAHSGDILHGAFELCPHRRLTTSARGQEAARIISSSRARSRSSWLGNRCP